VWPFKAAAERHPPTPYATAVIPAEAGVSTAELVINFDNKFSGRINPRV
jgi:hypothetical protein